jgi:hypothetical protein
MPTSFPSRFGYSLKRPFANRLEAFERAWEQHQASEPPPRWQDFLPPAGEPCPLAFLFWLLATDIDCRITAGLPALLGEPYFEDEQLRPAAGNAELLLELVRLEYLDRWHRGERARRQQYLERFPRVEEIRDLQPALPCPSCSREVLLADEDADGTACPHCPDLESQS